MNQIPSSSTIQQETLNDILNTLKNFLINGKNDDLIFEYLIDKYKLIVIYIYLPYIIFCLPEKDETGIDIVVRCLACRLIERVLSIKNININLEWLYFILETSRNTSFDANSHFEVKMATAHLYGVTPALFDDPRLVTQEVDAMYSKLKGHNSMDFKMALIALEQISKEEFLNFVRSPEGKSYFDSMDLIRRERAI